MTTQDAVPDDAALDALQARLYEYYRRGGSICCAEAADAIAALRAALARATADNVCDVCVGTGKPISGRECMCGGSGKMSDAVRYLRARIADQAQQIARAESERDKARIELNRLHANELPGGWTEELQNQIKWRHTAEQERDALRAALEKMVRPAPADMQGTQEWGRMVLDAHRNAVATLEGSEKWTARYDFDKSDPATRLFCAASDWMDRANRAERECDALRADAERYRWLRDECKWADVVAEFGWQSQGVGLDTAIAAARQATGKP